MMANKDGKFSNSLKRNKAINMLWHFTFSQQTHRYPTTKGKITRYAEQHLGFQVRSKNNLKYCAENRSWEGFLTTKEMIWIVTTTI